MTESKKHVFNDLEKKVFVEILKKYRTTVEIKKTDRKILRKKNATWHKIANEYNGHPYVTHQASSKQLRRLWMNMKQRDKEKMRTEENKSAEVATQNKALIIPVSQRPEILVKVDDNIDSDSVSEMALSTSEIEDDLHIFQLNTSTKNSKELSPSPNSTTKLNSTSPINVNTSQDSLPIVIPIQATPFDTNSLQYTKINILNKEYDDRRRQANEIHILEKELYKEKIREMKAKADLAEFILRQNISL